MDVLELLCIRMVMNLIHNDVVDDDDGKCDDQLY